MEKNDLTKQFSYRLRDSLIDAGYASQRSTSGVNIHKLIEITGYSAQICRKYLKGEVIPEPAMLVKIANRLKVPPGWLLFGDAYDQTPGMSEKITISRNLLHYIFCRAKELYTGTDSDEELGRFLIKLVEDISQINAPEEQSRKIIDLAFTSVHHFRAE